MKQRYIPLMRCVLVVILLFLITKSYAQEINPNHENLDKRILIQNPSTQELQSIAALGLDLHCGAKSIGNNLRLEVSSDALALLDDIGVNYEIQIEDVSTFYAKRGRERLPIAIQQLENLKVQAQAQGSNRSFSELETMIDNPIQYDECSELNWVSQNFQLGSMGGCLTVDEALAELDRMKQLFPHLISTKASASASGMQTNGNTTGNGTTNSGIPIDFDPQDIFFVRISDNPEVDEANEPESLITGMIHAREASSLMNIIYYMWYILENYDTDPTIQNMIDHQELYFVPITNPDGLKWNEIIMDGDSGGGQRKNLRLNVNDNGTINFTNNRRGIDLNRNSDYYWGFDNAGSSGSESADTYRGDSPGSENEIMIMQEFVGNHLFETAINHHAGLNSIVTTSYNGDSNAAPSGREDEFQNLLQNVTRYNRYVHGSAPNTLTPANGDINDWMFGGPAVAYNPQGPLTSNPSTGSGQGIITFSPENGDEFWPDPTEFLTIAQRAVRINLITSLAAGRYAKLYDYTTTNLNALSGQLDFAVENIGQTYDDIANKRTNFTLDVEAVSNNVTITTPSATALDNMGVLEQRSISASYTLDAGIQPNEPIEYKVTLSNDIHTIYEATFIKYHAPTVITTADGISNWSSTSWSQVANGFNGSTNAITSHINAYENGNNSTLTLNNVVDLSNVTSAVIHYNAVWDIERNFDLAQFEASLDGGATWTGLCGRHTRPAATQATSFHVSKNDASENFQSLNGTHIYDGDMYVDTTNDNTDNPTPKWVLEEIFLDETNNPGIISNNEVQFRFRFASDVSNRQDGYNVDFEGFKFDNFEIVDTSADSRICLNASIDSFPYLESFENGTGTFFQAGGDDGDWIINIGGTPSGNTGPTAAFHEQNYVYTEASTNNGLGPNATVILQSSCIDFTAGYEQINFAFNYHAFGTTLGTITTQISDDQGDTWANIGTPVGGPSSTAWREVTADLTDQNGKIVLIRFIGVTGGDFQSDLALDNIRIDALASCPNTTVFSNGNWSQGAPNSSTTAIIASDYNTASLGSITACRLTIEPEITLTIADNSFIKIENDITVEGTLEVSNLGSIVQVSEDAITRNNGFITVSKTTPSLNPRDFIVLTSPMSEESRTEVYGDANRVFGIIPSNFIPNEEVGNDFPMAANFHDDNGDYLDNGITTLAPSSGYLVFPQAVNDTGAIIYDHTYTQGTLNSGTIVAPITYNSSISTANFNLLGNPYASAIDTDMLISTNDVINEVYFWEHITTPNQSLPGFNTSNFSMDDVSLRNAMMGVPAVNDVTGSVPGQYMASGQGFGILANGAEQGAGTDVIFTNALRVTTNNSTPRSVDLDNKLWLQLSSENYDIQSIAALGFIPEASPGYDNGYDSRQLATSISLFSILENGEQLAIQGRELFNIDMEITLGFQTLIEGEENYTISIHQLEGFDLTQASIFLTDHITGTITNLKENDYSFTTSERAQELRFTLSFTQSTLNVEELAQNEFRLYPNPTQDRITLQTNGTSNFQKLIIRDILGKIVRTVDLSSFSEQQTFDMSKLGTGVYFFQITTHSSSESIRVIKY